ncbi:MAG: M23 family metallopeptidase [Patescibacteria group bacterium]
MLIDSAVPEFITTNINDTVTPEQQLAQPIDRASERVTKKNFGDYITVEQSPIYPERFEGYHTGTDFEIFPEELNEEMAIYAICTGDLKQKRTVSGYGGVVVQDCQLNDESVTIIYGHLKLASVDYEAGEEITAGDTIGILGADRSAETGNERKHLHLGIHKGDGIEILGYVANQSLLTDWIDPCLYVCD